MTDGLGRSLRVHRERRGWTRETLAHHSGVSWAAIAQIESGRRADVRLSSLSRLAEALDLSLDELVSARPPKPPPMSHAALFFSDTKTFADAAVPYLREGIAHDERPLAVISAVRTAHVREALGRDADKVTFADRQDWYRSPVAALNGYRDYLNDEVAAGARRVRILGEPVWRGRSSRELKAWVRYESLVNIVFAGSPSILLCPYSVRSTPKSVLAAAQGTHPRIHAGGTDSASAGYRDAEEFLLES